MLMSSETRQVSLDNILGFWARASIRFSEVRPMAQEKKQLYKVFKKALLDQTPSSGVDRWCQ